MKRGREPATSPASTTARAAALCASDLRTVRELQVELDTLHLADPDGVSSIGERLSHEFDLGYFLCYTLQEQQGQLDLARWQTRAMPLRLRDEFRNMLDAQPLRFGHFDPRRPEAAQQNRALVTDDLERFGAMSESLRALLRRNDLDGLDQLRILVCENDSLLAWFGGFRERPFGAREKAMLQALEPSLRRRFGAEDKLAGYQLREAALDAALEAIAGSAMIANGAGDIVVANAAARVHLERDARATRRGLLDAVRRHHNRANSTPEGEYSLTALEAPGVPRHFLAVHRDKMSDLTRRAAEARRRWGLTARQGDVLGLMARGLSNRAIAVNLGLREGTVELHVSAVLARAGAESRSAVVARFWTEL